MNKTKDLSQESDETLASLLRLSSDLTIKQEAFAEIYRRYANKIYGFLRGRMLSPEDAEDVTGVVFSELWQHPPEHHLASPEGLEKWLQAVALWRAMDARRKLIQRREREVSVSDVGEAELLAADPVIRLLEQEVEMQETLQEVLGALSPAEREIVKLATSGYTPRDIAQRLGISESAVYAHTVRAKRKLRQLVSSGAGG